MAKAIPINMDDVADVSFEPLPKGRYSAVVESVMYRVKEVSQGGSGVPYLNWTWNVTGPAYSGRKVFQTTSLKETALWNLKATLKALGLPHKGLISIEYDEHSGVVTSPSAVGKPAFLEISVQSDGKNNNVDAVIPISSPDTPQVGTSSASVPPPLPTPPSGGLK